MSIHAIFEDDRPVLDVYADKTKYDLHTYLKYVIMCIDKYGYSKSNDEYSTKMVAYNAMRHFEYNASIFSDHSLVENIDIQYIDDLISKSLEWVINSEIDNKYMKSVKKIVKLGYVTVKTIGYAASIIATYNKMHNLINLNIDAVNLIDNKSLVGTMIHIDVERFVKLYTNYFTTNTIYMYKIIDTSGNTYLWKTKKYVDFPVNHIYAKVKNIVEYDNNSYIQLYYCKLS